MDRTAKIKTGQDASNRTVALLFALAGLALRAAGASSPIRWLVLWALRRGERIAIAYVADCAVGSPGRAWSRCVVPGRPGSDPAAAIDLARSLRALALAVRAMAVREGRLPLLPSGEAADRIPSPARMRRRLAALATPCRGVPVPACDTS